MNDDILQDRDGAGKAMSGKLTNKVGTDSFRTAIIKDGDTTTMLRTKGGMREVTMTKVKPPETGPCVFFPLEEVDEAGEHTQVDRAYYHDHESDEAIPDRRIYTSDGIFSIVAKPTRRMRFKSVGLGKHLDVWFNDHSLPSDEKDPLATGSFEQGSITQEEKDNEVFDLAPVQCVEQLKRSATAKVEAYKSDELAFPDDSDARLQRRYYAPIFLNQESPPESGDKSKLQGLAFLISRIKTLAFKVTGLAGYNGLYKVFFGRYNNNLAAEVYPEEASGGLVERKISERVFAGDIGVTPLLQGLVLRDGTVSIAPPGGLLHPVRLDQWTTLNPMEKVSGDQYLRLSSLSNVVTFGQPWHGRYSKVTDKLYNEYGELIRTFDSSDTTRVNGRGFIHYVDFSENKEPLKLPDNTQFQSELERNNVAFLKDAVFYNGRYSLLPNNEVYLETGSELTGALSIEFPIKNSDGSVHIIRVTSYDINLSVNIRVMRKLDLSIDGGEQPYDPYVIFSGAAMLQSLDFYYRAADDLMRASPDGRLLFAGGCRFVLTGDAGVDLVATPMGGVPKAGVARYGLHGGVPSRDGTVINGSGEIRAVRDGCVGSWDYVSTVNRQTVWPEGGESAIVTYIQHIAVNINATATTKRTPSGVSFLLDMIYDKDLNDFVPVESLIAVVDEVSRDTLTLSFNYDNTYVHNSNEGDFSPPYSGPGSGTITTVSSRTLIAELLYNGVRVAKHEVPREDTNVSQITVPYFNLTSHIQQTYEFITQPQFVVSGFDYDGLAQSTASTNITQVLITSQGISNGPHTQFDNPSSNRDFEPQIQRFFVTRESPGVPSYVDEMIYHGKSAVNVAGGLHPCLDIRTGALYPDNNKCCIII